MVRPAPVVAAERLIEELAPAEVPAEDGLVLEVSCP